MLLSLLLRPLQDVKHRCRGGQKEPEPEPEFPGRWRGEWGSSRLPYVAAPQQPPPATSESSVEKPQLWQKCKSNSVQNCERCLLNLHCVKPPFELLWKHIDPPGGLQGCRALSGASIDYVDSLCRVWMNRLCHDGRPWVQQLIVFAPAVATSLEALLEDKLVVGVE